MNTEAIGQLLQAGSKTTVQMQEGAEVKLDILSKAMQDFVFIPDDNLTFENWYKRYEDLFKYDAASLDDAAQVRLLLRKIGATEYEKYTNFILPKAPRDIKFDETLQKLTVLFKRPGTLFSLRHNCIQTQKEMESIL